MIPPTLQQVKDAAVMQGISEDKAEQFWLHYEAQGWKRGNGQEVKNWRVLMTIWLRDAYGMQKPDKPKPVSISEMKCKICGGKVVAIYMGTPHCEKRECKRQVWGY